MTKEEIDKNPDFADAILTHIGRRIMLSAEQKTHFLSLLKIRRVLARQYVLQQEDICRFENYVFKGFLRSFTMDEKGNDTTLHFAMEDWWISDSTSFHRQQPATRNIVALEDSILLQISKEDLEQLYHDIPAFERFCRILEQSAGIAQDERILQSISMPGAERYEALIKKYPTLEQRLPLRHIASYLGMTPVFLSQIRRNSQHSS